jgi:hypothetical protein
LFAKSAREISIDQLIEGMQDMFAHQKSKLLVFVAGFYQSK